jgi:hypothetical protein
VKSRTLILFPVFLALLSLSLLHRVHGVRNPEHGDQAAYLELASNIHAGRGFVSRGLSPFRPVSEIEHPESVRGPLYPYLLSFLAEDSLRFFYTAKILTLILSMAVPLTAFIFLFRRDGATVAWIFVLLLASNRAFRLFATELWCENLLLLFCLPALLLIRSSMNHQRTGGESPAESLRSGGAAAGIVTGLLLGLGYLTKASAATILIAWIPVILYALAKHRVSLRSRPVRSAGIACIGFAVVVLPYLIWNRVTTGAFFRDLDLRGAFWLDSGRDFWIPHDTLPSAVGYLETHSLFDILSRLFGGLWHQAWNLVDLSATTFPGGEAVGVLILGLALVGLAVETSPGWRAFQIVFLALVLLLAGWYATIDVTPRFIYLLLPLVILNAARGLADLIPRIAAAAERAPVRWKNRWAVGAAGLLFLPTLAPLLGPLEGKGYEMLPAEAETIWAVRASVEPDEVLCMGPSHRLPYPWLIDRKTVFVPAYSNWDELARYLDRFKVRALLIDQEIFHRRPDLLGDFFSWTREHGLEPRQNLPGWRLVYRNSGPIGAFFLFVRTVEEKDPS